MPDPRAAVVICMIAAVCGGCKPLPATQRHTARPNIDPNPLAKHHGEITPIGFDQFFLLKENGTALILDARPAYFHRLGHIPDSVSFPSDEARGRLEELLVLVGKAREQGKTIVIYCHGTSCRDAGELAKLLSHRQIPVAIFSQGWSAWKKAGMPVESTLQVPAESATSPAP